MVNTLAPIILFVYNRPNHTRQVVESLLANPLAKDSNLYIYSDAPKDLSSQEKVTEVRNYIHSITGFKNITIIERERNFGLAENIIDGVSKIVNKYGKIIVLEDDIVVSPVFLEYINHALNHYEKENKVWSISAWNYPLDPNPIQEDTFFWRIPHCWGWGTWKDRWQYYRRDLQWVQDNFTKKDIYEVSLHNTSDYWKHFVLNKRGKIKTWAIFWYLNAYKHHALTLMPKYSYVKQIGFDGSGIHCGEDKTMDGHFVWEKFPITYPKKIQEKQENLMAIQKFCKKNQKPFFQRIINKIYNSFFKRNVF